MASKLTQQRLQRIVTLGFLGVAGLLGCSSASEPNAVLRVGSRNLRCPQSDLETALHRESSQVREYYVGCDFMYTRVLCTKPSSGQAAQQCHPATPQPPCFGGGCFKENPTTFEWELDETLASADPTLNPDASKSTLQFDTVPPQDVIGPYPCDNCPSTGGTQTPASAS